jgi:hypothetical protein
MHGVQSQRFSCSFWIDSIMKIGFCCLLLVSSTAWADSSWHCSRNTQDTLSSYKTPAADQFSIASVGSSTDVINVSIRDLIDLYSGTTVRISGVALSACFMPSNEALTSSALTALGLYPSTIQALSRRSSIVQSNLHLVSDEAQMLQCIEKHYPAVGYVSTTTQTEQVAPCF